MKAEQEAMKSERINKNAPRIDATNFVKDVEGTSEPKEGTSESKGVLTSHCRSRGALTSPCRYRL